MFLPTESSELVFYINGKKIIEKNADPEETLLAYLRRRVGLTGTKYGCGGGGCGACTVMISRYDPLQASVRHWAVNACLQPICSLYGAAVVTVEGVGSTKTKLHPVQERIAKAHGSQCGFCTPGMVMSMYTLLRNKLQPTIEDIREALGGNLCRCTGYRPIIDGFKTFCGEQRCCNDSENCCVTSNKNNQDGDLSQELYRTAKLLPLDPTQDIIFPPELLLMAQKQDDSLLCFQGERVKWVSPANLDDLIELKGQYDDAPLLVGNATLGPKLNLKGEVNPMILYAGRIQDLRTISWNSDGVRVGAACTLSDLKDALERGMEQLDPEKSRVYQALLQTLRCLAGKQIRNTATVGGNIMSANPKYDLSSILSAAGCTLHVVSRAGAREMHLNEEFFTGFGKTTLRPDEILLAVNIPYSKPWEIVSAFRQAQRREFAFPVVNAAMRVTFQDRSSVVKSLDLCYGGLGATLLKATKTCKKMTGRRWDEALLDDAAHYLQEEICLPSAAPGGRVEYRKTLALSFFFKFYLQVLLELNEKGVKVNEVLPEFTSALNHFANEVPTGTQTFQLVSELQSSTDPVGRPRMHQAAFQQATGEARYYDDIPPVKGELFVSMVTSTRAHAKIV